MKKKYKITISVLLSGFFLLAFAPPLNPPAGGWTQQFMPDLGGRQIVDITFTDSSNGYAITNRLSVGDTSFVLRTSNGGDNWIKIYGETTNSIFRRVQFLNQYTGYVGGLINFNYILKTTNAGLNWYYINAPYNIAAEDMYVLSEDKIWIVFSEPLTGGVFRTTNGGTSWEQQFSGGNQNPNKIYMYNERIGFMSNNSALPNIYKTTNGGENWSVNVGGERFNKIYFIDSLTGWRTFDSIKYTSDGGLNWQRQLMPYGGMIHTSIIVDFYNVNRDTIWGIGGSILYPNNQVRATLYRSTNNGTNWLFQIPDTSFGFPVFYFIRFSNQRNGWAYFINSGIHTITGGNDTFYTGLQQISSKIPSQYRLYQNYPNPFNPRTIISYELQVTSYVQLTVYDITGKKVIDLVNQKQNAGKYEVDFSGDGESSGVYFYSLIVNNQTISTKKMILIK